MNLEEKIISVITRELRLKEGVVTLDSHFKDDLGTDSLDEVEIVVALEDEFNKHFPDHVHDTIHTVQDLINEAKKLGL